MWPSNCSRSCLNTRLHKERFKDVRFVKKCLECGNEFLFTKSKENRKYCGRTCVYKAMYADKYSRVNDGTNFVNQILETPEFMRRVKIKINNLCFIHNCSNLKEDALQEWFASILMGQRRKLEHAVKSVRDDHRRKGITGTDQISICSVSVMPEIPTSDQMEWIETCIDIGMIHPEQEVMMIGLIAQGFSREEVYANAPKGKKEAFEKLFSSVRTEEFKEFLYA